MKKFKKGDRVKVLKHEENCVFSKKYIGCVGLVEKQHIFGIVDVSFDDEVVCCDIDELMLIEVSEINDRDVLDFAQFKYGERVMIKDYIPIPNECTTRVGFINSVGIYDSEFLYDVQIETNKDISISVHEGDLISMRKAVRKKEAAQPDSNDQRIPNYYKGINGLEARAVIYQFDLSYNVGTATTYLLRAGKKKENGMDDVAKHIEDLQKAINHLTFEIENLKTK